MSAGMVRGLAKNNERVNQFFRPCSTLLTSPREYASNHTPSIKWTEAPNQKGVIVLTCMDPRSNPNAFWNFGENGPAVFRNAGGRVTDDALRSMRILSTVMSNGKNTLGAVAVVHHTDCGLINHSNEFVANKLKERVRGEPKLVAGVDEMEFGGISDLIGSVHADVEVIRNDPYLPKDLEVIGFVHDVFSGKTTEVV